jgi:D-glycero-alpha-D-manno-heptose 1-phosphate guanylyltransferase
MEAIILAGGLGTRLRSVLDDLPKCMAPVAGKPFLHYLLNFLAKQNFNHVILSLGYMHEKIESWVSNSEWPFKISCSIEEEPLGTGGAIQKAFSLSSEKDVFVFNGDTFFEIDTHAFLTFHKNKDATICIALKPLKDFDRYGNVEIMENGTISAFYEKQPCNEGLINGGVYLINKELVPFPSQVQRFSFESDILQLHVGHPGLYGYSFQGYFIDIGIPEDYSKANKDFNTFL